MTEVTEHVVALGVLRAAYPGRFPDETVRVYMRLLGDVPADLLTQAVEAELRGGARDFIPSIGAIRRRAAEMQLKLPHPDEAWLAVRLAPRSEPQPDEVLQARDSVGDSWYWRNNEEAYIRRDFLAANRAIRERAVTARAEGDMSAPLTGLLSPTMATLPESIALAPRSFLSWDGVEPISDEMKHDAMLALRDLPPDHPAALAAFHVFDLASV